MSGRYRTMLGGALLFCGLIMSVFGQTADTFYVDYTNGDNSTGDGSFGNPYKTLGTAYGNLAAPLPRPTVIRIMPGRHYESGWYDGGKSVNQSNTLTIEAYDPDDPPILCTAADGSGTKADTVNAWVMNWWENNTTFRHLHFAGSSAGSFGTNKGCLRTFKSYNTIRNCVFYLNPDYSGEYYLMGRGISIEGGQSFTRISNCVFYGVGLGVLSGGNSPNLEIVNNVFISTLGVRGWGIQLYTPSGTPATFYKSRIMNNVFYNFEMCIFKHDGVEMHQNSIIYNLFYNCVTQSNIPLPQPSTNSTADPIFTRAAFSDGSADDLDLYLHKHSPCIDGGYPRDFDLDGGRVDLGVYGGVYADTAAPPRIDTLLVASDTVGTLKDRLTWAYSPAPADFGLYGVYRSDRQYFVPSTANLVDSISGAGTTTREYDNGGKTYYYRMNAWDTDEYGGGYRTFDTIPPVITGVQYHSNGTVSPSDDTLKVIFSEWIIDPFLFDDFANKYFGFQGEAAMINHKVGTGGIANDDTLVIYNFYTMMNHNRDTLVLTDPDTLADYNLNVYRSTAPMPIITYNVYDQTAGVSYPTIAQAAAAAAPGNSIQVLDDGWYTEDVTVSGTDLTIASAATKVPLLDGQGSGTVVTVGGTGNTLDGFRILDGITGAVVNGSGNTIVNCISYDHDGAGYSLAAGNSLLNSNAYGNGGVGVAFSGAGTCLNTVSSHNTGADFQFPSGMTQFSNVAWSGGASTNFTGGIFDPRYESTDPAQATFLQPQTGSKCLNTGYAVASVTTDILGNVRPQNTVIDIGAYEVASTVSFTLNQLNVTRSPATTAAGSAITMQVVAIDNTGDTLHTYAGAATFTAAGVSQPAALTYSGTGISSAGNGSGSATAAAWNNGVLTVQITYTVADDSLTVGTDASGVSGTSPSMMWYPAALSYIRVEEGLTGAQADGYNGGVITTTGSLNLHASAYDQYGNYRGDTTVTWTQLPGDPPLEPVAGSTLPASGTSYTFAPVSTSTGSEGRIIATLPSGIADTTGLVEVMDQPSSIMILTSGSGDKDDELTTATMTTDDTLTLYAAGFNSVGAFLGNYTVPWQWTVSTGSFSFDSTNAAAVTLRPTVTGSGTMAITLGTLSHAGTVTITVGSLASVRINRSDGTEITSLAVTTDDNTGLWCGGYDRYGNLIGNVTVDWSATLGSGADFSPARDSQTVYNASVPGNGTVVASYAAGITDSVPVTVTVGAVASVQIRDSLANRGSAPDSLSLMLQDTLTFYLAGYDADGNYVDDVISDWNAVELEPEFDYGPAVNVTSYLFGANHSGAGWVVGIYGTLTDSLYVFVTGTGPVFVSGATGDLNGDGYIDVFTVRYDEELHTDTVYYGSAGFSIAATPHTITIDSVVMYADSAMAVIYGTSDGVQDVTVTDERLNQDTDQTPVISYNGSAYVRDAYSNYSPPQTVVPSDQAGPALGGVVYQDGGTEADPSDDVMTIMLSEFVSDAYFASWAASPESVFDIIGIGAFGSDAQLSTGVLGNDNYLQIRMGTTAGGAAAVIPGNDSLKIRTGRLADMVGNVTAANNQAVLIHRPYSEGLILDLASFPNPFRSGTNTTFTGAGPVDIPGFTVESMPGPGALLKYTLNRQATVELVIYSTLGVPALKRTMNADAAGGREGTNFFFWDGANDRGRRVEAGTYIAVLKAVADDNGQSDSKNWRIGVVH